MAKISETTSQSWGSRIVNSLVGIGIGILLFIAGIVLLWWNEGRAVKTAKGLEEGATQVVSVEVATLDPANEGKLIHFTAEVVSRQTPTDTEFNVSATGALKLRRNSEMYQWEEESQSKTRTKVGGGTETVTEYSYRKIWSPSVIDSSAFQDAANHENPSSIPVTSETFVAVPITAGALTLPDRLVSQIEGFTNLPVPIPAAADGAAAPALPNGFTARNGGFYLGSNPNQPEIGDVRVTFEEVPQGVYSIVARQIGSTLEPYIAKNGSSFALLEPGTVSAEAMFQSAQDSNRILTWVLRVGGLIALLIGANLVLAPIGVVADVLPFLGAITRTGTGLIAALIAFPTAFITVAIAWLAYRPILGLGLLAVAVAIPVALVVLRKPKPAKA